MSGTRALRQVLIQIKDLGTSKRDISTICWLGLGSAPTIATGSTWSSGKNGGDFEAKQYGLIRVDAAVEIFPQGLLLRYLQMKLSCP